MNPYFLTLIFVVLAIETSRYFKQPLVIKGPGAGASVTASGVLNDIQNCIKI